MTVITPLISRLAAATLAATLAVGITACGTVSASTEESTSATTVAQDRSTPSVTTASAQSPTLAELVAEVAGEFSQIEWTDPDTGQTLTYNIYLPEGYDKSKSYPLVVYIPDSSQVGSDATAGLSQYGALIWASDSEQAKNESIVAVPAYPEVILDDHGSYTMTEYVEMTARLVEDLTQTYAVDTDRVYGTGQSMGAMTIMYLAATYPDLFAAEMIVSGQWDVTTLSGLAGEKFVYTAAAGDAKASGGQSDVEAMLDAAGISYNTAVFDATWSEDEEAAAAAELLSTRDGAHFLTFAEGTVLEASDGSGAMNSEHMASFQPAYEITALRDWLMAQTEN
ncbi:alpha/beta hydrolase-fold protein [Microbacterium schleiferi]|uniref:carboxylesterase family protein n=1 Tax=Microbacterium schleiferi TaxID=69362 RepID=UPI00311E1DA9